jgi:hypothetical protein
MPKAHSKNHDQGGHSRIAVVRAIARSTRPGTPARKAAIAETAAKVTLLGARGRHGAISETTLRRWVATYEAGGDAALIRSAGRGTATRHVHLSRQWDAAMHAADMDEWTTIAIAEAVRGCIRAAWCVTGGGWRQVQIAVLPTVASLSRSAGLPLGSDLLAGPCMLPRMTIDRDAPARRRNHPPALGATVLSND